MFDLWCLACLTEHHVSRVHLCYCNCQTVLPFHGCIIFHCLDGSHSVYSFSYPYFIFSGLNNPWYMTDAKNIYWMI